MNNQIKIELNLYIQTLESHLKEVQDVLELKHAQSFKAYLEGIESQILIVLEDLKKISNR